MEINTRSRDELKSYFVKNAIPTESNFADFIDGMINPRDDGVAKPPGNPLSIEASGDDSSVKRVLNLYSNFSATDPTWSLTLRPRANPDDPSTARNGLNIADASGASRLFIDHLSGAVGLGTVTPSDRLVVEDPTSTGHGGITVHRGRYAAIKVISDNYWAGIELRRDANGEAGRPHIDFTNDLTTNFGIRLSAPSNNAFAIEGGSVGIATTNPQSTLQIGNASEAVGLSLRGPDGNNQSNYIAFEDNAGAGSRWFRISHDTASNHLHIRSAEVDPIMSITRTTGDVTLTRTLSFGAQVRQMINLWKTNYGIGVQGHTLYFRTDNHFAWYRDGTHNNSSLNPGGGVRVMYLNGSNNLVLTGNGFKPGGGSWASSSDARLKKGVVGIESALDSLLQLRGIRFEWKDPESQGNMTGPQLGMVADEVEKVFPHWVEEDPDGYKSLTFRGFEALTVEALRELNQKIEVLSRKLDEMQVEGA